MTDFTTFPDSIGYDFIHNQLSVTTKLLRYFTPTTITTTVSSPPSIIIDSPSSHPRTTTTTTTTTGSNGPLPTPSTPGPVTTRSTTAPTPAVNTTTTRLAFITAARGGAATPVIDDSRSIASSVIRPTATLTHILKRLRGEQVLMNESHWMSDRSSTECGECQTPFTPFRRKHHCRVCGRIFCGTCASNLVLGQRFRGDESSVRVCNFCYELKHHSDLAGFNERRRPSPLTASASASSPHYLRDGTPISISAPIEASARPPASQFSASHLFPRSETPYSTFPPTTNPNDDPFDRISEADSSSSRVATPDFNEDGEEEEEQNEGEDEERDDEEDRDEAERGRGLRDSPGVNNKRRKSPLVFTAPTPIIAPTLAAPFRKGLLEEEPDTKSEGLGIVDAAGERIGEDHTEDRHHLTVASAKEMKGGGGRSENDVSSSEGISSSSRLLLAPPTSPMLEQEGFNISEVTLDGMPTITTKSSPLLETNSTFQTFHSDSHPLSPPVTSPRLLSLPSEQLDPSSSILLDTPHDGPGPNPRELHRILADNDHLRSDDLSPATLLHLRTLLRQAFQRHGIMTNLVGWETTLMKILRTVASDPKVDARTRSDAIDVRQYVRVKKVPGGKASDSEYVAGVVFTKNIVDRTMPREILRPRIMLLAFPLEFARTEQQRLVSLDPVIRQEREYLRGVISRIVALRPHVVLVERNVSRLAVEYLGEAGIAVARNVKRSVMLAVARATEADLIVSIDQLAVDSTRLGTCERFGVATFVHGMIPGRRKTFLRFEECRKEWGGTIVLRGGDWEELSKMKKIVRMMIGIVYDAKLTGALFRDELVLPLEEIMLTSSTNGGSRNDLTSRTGDDGGDSVLATTGTTIDSTLPSISTAAQDRERVSSEIDLYLRPYRNVALSSTPYITIPPPHVLVRMSEEDRKLTNLRALREYEEMEQILHDEEEAEAVAVKKRETSSSSVSEGGVVVVVDEDFTSSSAALDQLSLEGLNLELPDDLPTATLPILPSTATADALVETLKVIQPIKELARATAFLDAEQRHADQLVLWDDYLSASVDSFDPAQHQRLHLLRSLACTQTDRLCIPPTPTTIEFYDRSDLSIGQYLEKWAREAGRLCGEGCARPMLAHYETFVHGSQRVMIIPEAHHIDLQRPELEGQIVMWSWCKICQVGSAQEAMSDETYHLSMAKYLELSFYRQNLLRRDRVCEHDAHQDHVRFCMFHRITFQIIVDPIELRDVVLPPLKLKVQPVQQLELRNDEFLDVFAKVNAFFDSIAFRISSFHYDSVPPERVEECRTTLHEWKDKAEVDRRAVLRGLRTTYQSAIETNGSEMTAARRALQTLAVSWDALFSSFEKKIFPSDKDVRRLTTLQLKRLFSDTSSTSTSRAISPDRRQSATSSILSTSLEEVDEKDGTTQAQLDEKMSLPVVDPSVVSISTTPTPLESIVSSSNAIPPVAPLASDAESDSTVCADPPPSSTLRHRSNRDYDAETSEAESEVEPAAGVGRNMRTPGRGVADLVHFFSDSGHESPSGRDISIGSPSRTRTKNLRRSDIFSDGGGSGYAANVGVAHLAKRANAEAPSRIPYRVSKHGPTSTSTSIPKSGKKSPIALEGLARVGASNKGKGRSLNLRSGSVIETPTSRPRLLRATTTTSTTNDLSRPTTSSINKSSLPRRLVVTSARTPSSSSSASHVSTIARHFNDKAREYDRSRLAAQRGTGGRRGARPVADASLKIDVFDNVRDAVRAESDSEGDGGSSDGGGADDELEFGEEGIERDEGEKQARCSPLPLGLTTTIAITAPSPSISTSTSKDHSNSPSDSEGGKEDGGSVTDSSAHPSSSSYREPSVMSKDNGETSGNERGSIIKTLASLWSYRGAEFTKLEFPLHPKEHLFSANPVLVREDEPSSIVAFALCSQAYRDKLNEPDLALPPRVVERSEAFMPPSTTDSSELPPPLMHDRSGTTSTGWGVVDLEEERADVDTTLRKTSAKHFRLQFEEGTTSFYCKIFFAEQFDALRRQTGCESQFTESLARCVSWISSGGRSNVDFLKTKDDRFIVKEITQREMDAFLLFAPAYFEYYAKAIANRQPTILAKILGFYRIGLRNSSTGKTMRLDVLVMENLFYDRKLSQVFDLKGSTRNRKVEVSSESRPGEVLMDENLVQISFKNPLYVREAAKVILQEAIYFDATFLAHLNVMDYSLVVGVDSENQELVVGIVDFIRTFTWEKKLENLVKESALLGGGTSSIAGKPNTGPTIVTPIQYRNRFRSAMNEYFLLAPDAWYRPSSALPPTHVPDATVI